MKLTKYLCQFHKNILVKKIVSQVVKRLKKIVMIEKDDDNWKRLWLKKSMLVIRWILVVI